MRCRTMGKFKGENVIRSVFNYRNAFMSERIHQNTIIFSSYKEGLRI